MVINELEGSVYDNEEEKENVQNCTEDACYILKKGKNNYVIGYWTLTKELSLGRYCIDAIYTSP